MWLMRKSAKEDVPIKGNRRSSGAYSLDGYRDRLSRWRVISILPNADTIAEAFYRGVSLTVGEEFHGLPKGILVDCGKDYRSALLHTI